MRHVGIRFALALSISAALACGGASDNSLGPPDDGDSGGGGGGDSGSGGDATLPPDGGATDGPVSLDGPIPTRDASTDAGVCGPLPAGALDVYVDQRYKGPNPTGAAACPLPTILQGIAAAAGLSGTRTVHVAGASPALVYAETAAVPVPANVILKGDGAALTTITATGTCGSGVCAVLLAGGATIDGFSVTSPAPNGGDGIVAAHATPAPIVKNVAATGCKGSGVLALGAIELGPNIVASKNGAQGLQSPVAGTGTLHVINGSNAFDGNTANGINVDGPAVVSFEGGSASNNGINGVRLFGSSGGASLPTHVITGLSAIGNKNTGISVFNPQNLTLRSSKLLSNTNLGLLYDYANGTTLDIGTTGSVGNNVFGGATSANNNGKAGIYLCRSRGDSSQPAEGNSWAACPPTQTALAACDVLPSTYTDVAYTANGGTTGAPVVASTCTVGP